MLLLLQCLVYFRFTPSFLQQSNPDVIEFILVSVGICCIAIGGNLVNALVDQKTDSINKPSRVDALQMLGERKVKLLYFLFSAVGILCGVALSVWSNKLVLAVLFINVCYLLWAYSYQLKGKFLVGNLTVSALLAISLLIVFWAANLFQSIQYGAKITHIFLMYIFFAFMLNLIREIVKDAEDVIGDYACNHQTLPIVLGKKRTNVFLQTLVFIVLLSLIWVYFHFFYAQLIALFYIFFLLIGIGVFVFFKLNKAKTKKDYSKLSVLIKVWMFLGIITLAIV